MNATRRPSGETVGVTTPLTGFCDVSPASGVRASMRYPGRLSDTVAAKGISDTPTGDQRLMCPSAVYTNSDREIHWGLNGNTS